MKKICIVLVFCILMMFSIAKADSQISVPAINLDYMRAHFNSRYDCGVGAMAELIAFWGTNGYPRLLKGGTFTGQIPDNGEAMTNLHGFFLKRENSGFNGSVVPPETLATYLQKYFTDNGYRFTVTRDTYPYWREIVAELDAKRPVITLLYGANHYVVSSGHTINPKTLTMLWGHNPYIRVVTQSQALSWWPIETWYVIPLDPPDTEPPPPLPPDPSTQPWYSAVMQWCQENGWELEPID